MNTVGNAPNYSIVTPPNMMMMPPPPPYSSLSEYSMPPAYGVIQQQAPYVMQQTMEWNGIQWNSTTTRQQPSIVSYGGTMQWQQQSTYPTSAQVSLPIATMPNVPSGIIDAASSSSHLTPELPRHV
jgi:hypothetical protein